MQKYCLLTYAPNFQETFFEEFFALPGKSLAITRVRMTLFTSKSRSIKIKNAFRRAERGNSRQKAEGFKYHIIQTFNYLNTFAEKSGGEGRD